MPAKTPVKKASAARKPVEKKSTKPAKGANGASKSASNGAPKAAAPKPANGVSAEAQARETALKAELEKAQSGARDKEQQLRSARDEITSLQKQVENGKKADPELGNLQARVTTLQAELQAARTEAANLREAVKKAQQPGPRGAIRCPRCSGKMTEYEQDTVKADRCDTCHGIFLDNGELETVIDHHDKQRDAGSKHWYSGLFGKR